jgi:hypothetical protein
MKRFPALVVMALFLAGIGATAYALVIDHHPCGQEETYAFYHCSRCLYPWATYKPYSADPESHDPPPGQEQCQYCGPLYYFDADSVCCYYVDCVQKGRFWP